MRLVIYDPQPGHEYLTKMFFVPMFDYAFKNGIKIEYTSVLTAARKAVVLTLADHLDEHTVTTLKNNKCKIVGFSITDSSYISQACREAEVLKQIDLIFALTGLQTVNEGQELVVDSGFNVSLEKRPYLPEKDWAVFDQMRRCGRIQSLPYVHWERQAGVEPHHYVLRSQKALIRGGCHGRRFILALFLMRHDLLDTNSGFITSPYFAETMTPQFRFCQGCRQEYRHRGKAVYSRGGRPAACVSPAEWGKELNLSNLGQWNNACPKSFYWLAEQFIRRHGIISMVEVEKLLNGQWLNQKTHLELLSRITFTSDLKWLFSIYVPQRFWDAALTCTINLLPKRTMDQEFFPPLVEGEHYISFKEDFANLEIAANIVENDYYRITNSTLALYNEWLRPADYCIGTNLLRHIFEMIKKFT